MKAGGQFTSRTELKWGKENMIQIRRIREVWNQQPINQFSYVV